MIESIASLFQRIGRYFSLVSVVPGVVFVVSILFLMGAVVEGPGFGFAQGWSYIADLGLGQWVGVVGVAIGSGLLLHPLQYALTQAFEGYWGPGRGPRMIATKRIMAHRRRAAALEARVAEAKPEWLSKAHRSRPWWFRHKYRGTDLEALRQTLALERLHSPDLDFVIPVYVDAEASAKALTKYPRNHGRMMPTRLGNILRRHEDEIGSVLGLDSVIAAPFLSQVARDKDLARVSDEGEQMDLALRLSLVFLLTTLVYAFVLVPRGPWALMALVPYTLAYIAYRGACMAAENYMTAVAVMVHLNRFAFYEALHLGRPENLADEREIAARAMTMITESNYDSSWRYG